MNGCILGMKRWEIDRKLDEIIDFSGCERYIDTPVKRYSSGMMVRLGFAVAAHLDPEILVVDEVLAVGDAEFQKKAIGKMQDVSRGEGRTVLFVSHNMESIRSLCETGLLLNNGINILYERIDCVVNKYLNENAISTKHSFVEIDKTSSSRIGYRDVEFISFYQPNETMTYASDEDIVIHIKIKAYRDVPNCRISNTIRTTGNTSICNNSSNNSFSINKGEIKTIEYTLINPGLVVGVYNVSFSVGTGTLFDGERNFDIIENAISFHIDKVSSINNLYYSQWNHHTFGYIASKTTTKILE